jgi:hypothetical protein
LQQVHEADQQTIAELTDAANWLTLEREELTMEREELTIRVEELQQALAAERERAGEYLRLERKIEKAEALVRLAQETTPEAGQ